MYHATCALTHTSTWFDCHRAWLPSWMFVRRVLVVGWLCVLLPVICGDCQLERAWDCVGFSQLAVSVVHVNSPSVRAGDGHTGTSAHGYCFTRQHSSTRHFERQQPRCWQQLARIEFHHQAGRTQRGNGCTSGSGSQRHANYSGLTTTVGSRESCRSNDPRLHRPAAE